MKDKERFNSKRNYVFYEGSEKAVIKRFSRNEDFQSEKMIYHELKRNGFKYIPKLLFQDLTNKELHLEYLEGPTVLEVLEELEVNNRSEEAVSVLIQVIDWLDCFYEKVQTLDGFSFTGSEGLIMGDVNLRNFLYVNKNIYGLDFERIQKGKYTEEKCELLARYLIYDPIYTVFKNQVVQQVIKHVFQGEELLKKRTEVELLSKKILSQRNIWGQSPNVS